MQYIVIDLEWNQPMSYDSAVYRQVGDRLIFEMIQIGAVKLNNMTITSILRYSSLLVRMCEEGGHVVGPLIMILLRLTLFGY